MIDVSFKSTAPVSSAKVSNAAGQDGTKSHSAAATSTDMTNRRPNPGVASPYVVEPQSVQTKDGGDNRNFLRLCALMPATTDATITSVTRRTTDAVIQAGEGSKGKLRLSLRLGKGAILNLPFGCA
ncbi:MAG TPA: hypothetical protein VGF28_11135 [Thermoanaerobaculia bacterium]|jgi:hypothetical protein